LGSGFIDLERSPGEIMSVEALNCRLGFLVRSHLDKAKTFGLAGEPIRNNVYGFDGAHLGEEFFEISLRRIVGKIADIQLLCHCYL
jgi:hypothetical protein